MQLIFWWLQLFIQIVTVFLAGMRADGFPAWLNAGDAGCQVHVKMQQVRILADEGDGLFDGKMEVKIFLQVDNGTVMQRRDYPRDSHRKAEQNSIFRLEGYTFSVKATDEIRISILAVEIDELPRIAGVDIGQAVRFIGESARAGGAVGRAVDSVFDAGVNAISDVFAEDDILVEETLILPRTVNWNAAQSIVYRTSNGNLELTYSVSYSGCEN